MRLSELIELLELHQQAAGDADPEVRIAYQPNYPLAAEVSAVTKISGEANCGGDEPTIWIAASSGVNSYSENPYAPQAAWDGDEVDLTEGGEDE